MITGKISNNRRKSYNRPNWLGLNWERPTPPQNFISRNLHDPSLADNENHIYFCKKSHFNGPNPLQSS